VRWLPLILSAPSGGGKTTIAKRLLAARKDLGYSVSCTTRQPRPGEVDGRDYHFWSRERFDAARTAGEFVESALVHGNLYGTLRAEIDRVLSGKRHVIMDIDVQGAAQFSAAVPEAVLVFLLPPSAEVLVGRLEGRGSEDPKTLALRLRNAGDELRAVSGYHYAVVNDDLERATHYVSSIIDAESVRRKPDPTVAEHVQALMTELDDRLRKLLPD
jgi:guanylate kinase